MAKKQKKSAVTPAGSADYEGLLYRVSALLEQGRRSVVRTVNAMLTATYWEVGRQIVEFEQAGKSQAAYGDELLKRLSKGLSAYYGRGFSQQGLYKMRAFYLGWEIFPTVSGKLQARVKNQHTSVEESKQIVQTVSAQLQPLVAT